MKALRRAAKYRCLYRSHSKRLAAAFCVAITPCFVSLAEDRGPLSPAEIAHLQERAIAEGWSFRVGRNEATLQSLDLLRSAETASEQASGTRVARIAAGDDLPRAFDWREMGGCAPIRNCSVCGADWAFVTTALLESALLIRKGLTVDLSERWLIDCNQNAWGCSRGTFAFGYFLESNGVTDPCGHSGAVLERDLPYIAGKLPCKCPYAHEYFIRSWSYLAPESGSAESGDLPSVDSIKQAIIDHGPVAAMVTISDPFWAYEEGVFGGTASAIGTPDLHVVLVGWNDDLGKEGAWILRNCWGTGWGEQGYMNIEYGCSNVGFRAAIIEYVGEDSLYVNSPGELNVSGVRGRDFSPRTLKLALENRGDSDLTWNVEETIPWADSSPVQGELGPHGTCEVAITINDEALRAKTGRHRGKITVTHVQTGVSQERFINLEVHPPTVYEESLDHDPHWQTEGRWAFGTPLGACDDPSSGYTGTNVYGYALNGCYGNNSPEYFLTSLPFNCLPYSTVRLGFMRWLGIKAADEDGARVQASRDGIHWFDVWAHTEGNLDDRSWVSCDYDVSRAVAGANTAYFRWGMGPTGRPDPSCGWNIDDIEIMGDCGDVLLVLPADATVFDGPEGGAFEPTTAELSMTNTAAYPLEWRATVSADWLNVSALGGRLDADKTIRLQLSMNAHVLHLGPGIHSGAIVFSNLTSGASQQHNILLKISEPAGRIRIQDSIWPPSDQRIDFGPVTVGTARTAEVTVANIDANHPLTLKAISLNGIFDENFETALMSDWVSAGPAQWELADGRLLAHMSGEDTRASIRYDVQQWQDATLSVEASLPESGVGGMALFVRASADFDWSVPRGSAYALGIEQDGRHWVGRYRDGAFSMLEDKTGESPSGPVPATRTLTLSAHGSTVEARIDDTLVWSGKDTAVAGEGYVAFGVYADSPDTLEYAFDNLKASPPDKLPQASPFEIVSHPELPLTLAPFDKTTIMIQYEPAVESFDVARLDFWSNDRTTVNPSVEITGDAYKPIHFVHAPLFDTTDSGPYRVQVEASARFGLRAVRLVWSTDGGATTNTINMLDLGNGVYEALIPEQPIGTRVWYRLEAVDLQNDASAEPDDGFLTFQVRGIPQLSANPGNLSFVVAPNTAITQVLRLANTGTWPVDWSVFSLPELQASLAAPSKYVPAEKRSRPANWDTDPLADTLLVGFRNRAGAAEKSAAHSALDVAFPGTEVVHRYRRIPVDVVRAPQKANLEEVAKAYERQPGVAYVEPNARLFPAYLPSDPQFRQLWGLDNEGQTGGAPDADIDAPEAWDLERGSHDVIVAVIDTGIDYDHEDLSANIWVNTEEQDGRPGVDDDGNGIIDDIHGARWQEGTGKPSDGNPMDVDYHGTHCAGTIGALGDNDKGVVGVNWAVTLMPLKFLSRDGGWTADAIAALEYAMDKGARLTSNSWGGGMYSQALEDMIAASAEAGMLFVCAAGNEGVDIDTSLYYPACYSVPNVIAVAASDSRDQRASFSNYGAIHVHLAAPGAGILSTFPENTYGSASGTSMATPHVSGVAALLSARVPGASPELLKQWLIESVDPLPEWSQTTVSGGRLNAANAVLKAGVPWLDAEPSSGNLQPGQETEIAITVDTHDLADGYVGDARLVFTGEPQGSAETSVDLLVAQESFTVTPDKAFKASGQEGGSLTPSSFSCSIRNLGGTVLQWNASAGEDWIDINPSGGSIPPHQASDVTLLLNEKVTTLPTGIWRTGISFTRRNTPVTVTREAVLIIDPPPAVPFYSEPLDTDPGWDIRGDWQFGPPSGECLDPSAAHTGANVYGNNLGGCYPQFVYCDMLTTTPIDCSKYSGVTLRFWRWFSMETFQYDRASFWASNDLENWSLVWSHIGDTFGDTEWKQQTFNIGPVADGRSTVYVCWVLGPTDENVELGGWNIDDIELLGRLSKDLAVVPYNGLQVSRHSDEFTAEISRTYTLWNMSKSALAWHASNQKAWLHVSQSDGTLEPSASAQITVSADMRGAPPGQYGDVVTFANHTTQTTQTRNVDITVLPPVATMGVTDSVGDPDDKAVAFGMLPVGESTTADATIHNLHKSNELVVSSLAISGPTPCPFALQGAPEPPIRILPRQMLTFQIVFRPLAPGSCTAELQIASNDATDGDQAVSLTGEALPEGAPLLLAHPLSQTVNPGDVVAFVVRAQGNLLSYQWEKDEQAIKGATLAPLTIPRTTQEDAGLYSCRVSNPMGSVASNAARLEVREPPTAAFTADPTSGLAPLDVTFKDGSIPGDAPIVSWSWSFGDGGTATDANPIHKYTAVGTYTVSLEVKTSFGADLKESPGLVTVTGAEGEGEGETSFGCYAKPPAE